MVTSQTAKADEEALRAKSQTIGLSKCSSWIFHTKAQTNFWPTQSRYASNENLKLSRNRKGWHSHSVSFLLGLLWRGRKDVRAGGKLRPTGQDTYRDVEAGKATAQSSSWAVNNLPFTHIRFFPIFSLLNCNPKHTADVISFSPITGPSEVNDFPSFSQETISFCSNNLLSPLLFTALTQGPVSEELSLPPSCMGEHHCWCYSVLWIVQQWSTRPTDDTPRDIFLTTKGLPGDTARQCGRRGRWLTETEERHHVQSSLPRKFPGPGAGAGKREYLSSGC